MKKRPLVKKRPPAKKRLWGQYFTPPETAGFLLEAARLTLGRKPGTLLDPACGDGVFLESALGAGLVRARGAFGIEIDPAQSRRAARLGLGRKLARADALLDPLPRELERVRARDGGFDLVVGNPPFGGGGGAGRLEVRFAGRFAELVRPGGVGAVILPYGVFANASAQALRDSLLETVVPTAVVELPPGTFRHAGAAAATCVLVFRRTRRASGPGRTPASPRCVIVACGRGQDHRPRDARGYFASALRAIEAGRDRRPAQVEQGRAGGPAVREPYVRDLAGRRWDPGCWARDPADILSRTRVPLEPLGRFIEHITYGPILTGEAAGRDLGGRVRVVGLKQLRPAGLDLRGAKRVRAGGVHDPARCRLRPGDVVLARSGAGSLLQGRVGVFDGPGPATVGCFVDLVRLSGVEPGFVALCLRSRLVRAQVAAIANGVGTPNLSFGEIRGLLIPRLGDRLEAALAREEAAARRDHARARAEARLGAATTALEEAALTGSCRLGSCRLGTTRHRRRRPKRGCA